jgi:regulator of replication initiation timing
MTKEQLRMQMLSGIITENQYKLKLTEDDMSDSVNDETYEKMNSLVDDNDYDNFINSATNIMKNLMDEGFEVKDIFHYLQTRLTAEV